MTRQDIHRPSAINPEEYEFVDCIYIGCADVDPGVIFANADAREHIRRHMEATGGRYSSHDHGGTCHVCGATALYLAVFYHPATNRYIQTGEDCAAKIDMGQPETFRALRAGVDDFRQAQAGKQKARAVLSDLDLDAVWRLYELDRNQDMPALVAVGAVIDRGDATPAECARYCNTTEFCTILDLLGKLIQYGNISEKQVAFLRTLLDRMARRNEIEAERAAEKEAAAPVPTGRQTVTGEVLKTEVRETAYGRQLKMAVKAEAGFVLWGSVPGSIGAVNRGDKVTFTATLQPSDRDPKFGFFSRPTKASVSQAAVL